MCLISVVFYSIISFFAIPTRQPPDTKKDVASLKVDPVGNFDTFS